VRVTAVSFDFTGTLAGLSRLGEVYAQVLRRHGVEVAPERVGPAVQEIWQELSFRVPLGQERFGGHPDGAVGFWRQLLEAVCRRLELPAPTAFAAAELYERFAHPEPWDLFPDVRPCLAALREGGLRLAVVSNFDQRLPRLLSGLELKDCFEAVVYSAAVGVEKPHPAIFEALLEELALPPAAVLHVGDSQREDLEGAQAVGLRAMLLDRAGGRGGLPTLAELPPRLGLAGHA
jgi:putative hydrolase of the HAD superfamily